MSLSPVVSIVGRLVLATLLAPALFQNDYTQRFSIVVHAQEESHLRGSVPIQQNDDVVPVGTIKSEESDESSPLLFEGEGEDEVLVGSEEEMEDNPAKLELVEGMMTPGAEDDGGLVMAHGVHGLQSQHATEESPEEAAANEERLDGFIKDLVSEEGEQAQIVPVELGHPPENDGGAFMGQPSRLHSYQNEMLPPSAMNAEGMNDRPLSEVVPLSEISSVEEQMGPVPQDHQQFMSPSKFQEGSSLGGHPSSNTSPHNSMNSQGFMGQQSQPMMNGGPLGTSQPNIASNFDVTATRSDMVPVSKDTCPIPAPKAAELEPTMVASYPGSGAKLTWKLIRAVSGYMTSDDAVDLGNLAKNKLVIAIKTHFPARGSSDDFFAPFVDVKSSILLIRNPFNAIPSFLSFLYEQSQNLTGHSVRAPLDVWISWRDRHFDHELELWLNHARFWMKHHEFENRMILPYEYLIKPGSGPTELRKVRTFLEKHAQVEMRTPKEKVACIWDYIVMKRADQGNEKGSMRKGGPKVYSYTPEQVNTMKKVLEGLKREFPGELGSIMELYIYQINEAQTAMNY